MQTFLPYPSFVKSAKVLDNKRLGKQRVETWQIFNTLEKIKNTPNEKIPWKNHPIVKMWNGYSYMLLHYGYVISKEWQKRGFKDTMAERFIDSVLKISNNNISNIIKNHIMPPWIGDKEFHASHRSNLLRKDYDYYKQFNWKEENNLPYKWVV